MNFESTQIKGRGRGKQMGVPTINLKVPEDFNIADGVYACLATIESMSYKGALHIGPVPTFEETERTIEIYILDVDSESFPNVMGKKIGVIVKKKIRDVEKFNSPELLIKRIVADVSEIRQVLSDS